MEASRSPSWAALEAPTIHSVPSPQAEITWHGSKSLIWIFAARPVSCVVAILPNKNALPDRLVLRPLTGRVSFGIPSAPPNLIHPPRPPGDARRSGGSQKTVRAGLSSFRIASGPGRTFYGAILQRPSAESVGGIFYTRDIRGFDFGQVPPADVSKIGVAQVGIGQPASGKIRAR